MMQIIHLTNFYKLEILTEPGYHRSFHINDIRIRKYLF